MKTTAYRSRPPFRFGLTIAFFLCSFGGTSLFALETTSAVISKDELRKHVAMLASEEFKGRNPAGEGGLIAAEYLAAEFKKLGLKPAGDEGGYFQEFSLSQSKASNLLRRTRASRTSAAAVFTSSPAKPEPDSKATPSIEDKVQEDDEDTTAVKAQSEDSEPPPMSDEEIQETARKLYDWLKQKMNRLGECEEYECRNVLALLPGTDPELKEEVILVSAHYDHLGVRDGKVYNGADDNASGTATVLELARVLKSSKPGPRRSILFAAWDAEEKGLCGSWNWTTEPTLPLEKVVAVINLDMIGRLREKGLLVLGLESSQPLDRIITAQAKRAKIKLRRWEKCPRSDHWPFFVAEIPSITFCTGSHKDYHKPTDDIEWILFTNLARIARMSLDIVNELANRDERVEFTFKDKE